MATKPLIPKPRACGREHLPWPDSEEVPRVEQGLDRPQRLCLRAPRPQENQNKSTPNHITLDTAGRCRDTVGVLAQRGHPGDAHRVRRRDQKAGRGWRWEAGTGLPSTAAAHQELAPT